APGSDPNYQGSASGSFGYVVSTTSSQTTITGTTPAAPAFGDQVTLTATVGLAVGGVEPTGTVTFKDGGVTLGTGTLRDVTGTATSQTGSPQLAQGSNTLTAVYNPASDPNYRPSISSGFTLTVAATQTTTVITAASPASPSTFGQAVTFTATVTPNVGTGVPA